MPKQITKIIESLQNEVEKDSFNLTRDDHDAISVKINELKDFISNVYEDRKKAINLHEQQ